MAKEQKNKREIYTLNDLPPEVVAVTFAKCSRSPESFQDIADELTDELSADFSEKWIVGYGHSSVAEHAVLSLAIENVSILATKVIEDNRLCSYTEKSTRYQIYDRDKYYQPKNVLKSKHEKLYRQTCDFLMDTYNNLYEPMNEFLVKKYPREKDVAEKLHAARLKAKTCDNVRYILPVATLTNLGMTANARNLEYAIAKMLSHPLEEIQQIGEEIKTAATKVTPTLIKYANANEYLTETTKELNDIVQKTLPIHNIETSKPVELIDYDQDADDKLVTALLYRFSDYPYKQVLRNVKKMNQEEKEEIVDSALKRLGKFDRPLRELEHINYTFDILIDYGAFRDIQRHRMCTQTNQLVTTKHGYEIPDEIEEAGLKDYYVECMQKSQEAFEKIYNDYPNEAQYVVSMAFRKKVLFTWNLRELHHFIKLRTGPTGHISYRRMAYLVWEEIEKVHPFLAKYIDVTKP